MCARTTPSHVLVGHVHDGHVVHEVPEGHALKVLPGVI